MSRYIDADALIEAIKNELWDWQSLDDITATCVLKQTITDIQNAPTADVRENVHARWVKVGQSFLNPNRFRCYACSECGFSIDYIPFRFCPNCGAQMDERSEE